MVTAAMGRKAEVLAGQAPTWNRGRSKGTGLERAALGQLHELAREAWAARARGGAEDFRRAWAAGLVDVFDELEIVAGRVEARAAFDWAIRRLDAITIAVTGAREPTDAA